MLNKQGTIVVGIILCLILTLVSSILYAWPVDNGIAICTTGNDQGDPIIVSDGLGGAIITWYDYRSGTNWDIYAQRVNSAGSTLWTLNGVAICTAMDSQITPTIVTDGSGGVIMTWQDWRNDGGLITNSDIYAQHVNSTGSTLWTLNGVAICTTGGHQGYPDIVSDESYGAIITWLDWRSGGLNSDIYAQRLNSTGSTLWSQNGVAICTAGNIQYHSTIVSDGSGGAIITWQDYRNTTGNPAQGSDIYIQRVNSVGSSLWTLNGVAIGTAVNVQDYPAIINDGSGGAIITWMDGRYSGDTIIFIQRVDSSGVLQWTLTGVALCTAGDNQLVPTIVSDGTGGAIITWEDFRNSSIDIYTQRVNNAGLTLWPLDGIAICTASYIQKFPSIMGSESGGAIITWEDHRSGSNYDIYAQKIDGYGSIGELVSVPKEIWQLFP